MSESQPSILYVDDERANRVVFEASFGPQYPVVTAASGEEALNLMGQQPVGVLVTDQRMPGMSGNELLELVKRDHPEVIRIVVTAYSDLDPILRAVNEGLVARYVIKPWSRDQFEEILNWAVEAYDVGRSNGETQLRLLRAERLATLGSIMGALIHDLNQPLSYIFSSTERLNQLAGARTAMASLLEQHGHEINPGAKQQLEDLIEELPELVDDMYTGCKMMRNLTTNVRGLLTPDTQEVPLCKSPYQAIDFVQRICRRTALRAGGEIVYDGPENIEPVAISQTALIQVLVNLVSNAAQALERRSPDRRSPGRVTITVNHAQEGMRVVVADDGDGMSEEVQAKIGTPFFSTRAEGLGLGLTQCRRLIEGSGGSLTFASEQGKGTQATIIVPWATTEAAIVN